MTFKHADYLAFKQCQPRPTIIGAFEWRHSGPSMEGHAEIGQFTNAKLEVRMRIPIRAAWKPTILINADGQWFTHLDVNGTHAEGGRLYEDVTHAHVK